jgi:predicted TIM-barrel fold metal-dependent hydrolase
VALTRIISCDDHMDLHTFPPKLFEERVAPEFRARAPRVIETPQGPYWQAEGELLSASGSWGMPMPSIFLRAGLEDNWFRPSTPQLRLEDMDRDGLYAQVIYGPPVGLRLRDPLLKAACLRAYNDWAADFNSYDPDRLCMLAILPMHDPEATTAELRRVAGKGLRGAVVSLFEAPRSVFEPEWEAFWATAAETRLPISFHLSAGTYSIQPQLGRWQTAAFSSVVPMQLDEALAGMVFSGMLDRNPRVTLVLGESGLGWVPYLIERMDLEARVHANSVAHVGLTRPPSAICRDQVVFTYEEDHFGHRFIPELGADNVMWASDYPHPDSTFPNSRRAIDAQFAEFDETVKQKVCHDNAARLYGLG